MTLDQYRLKLISRLRACRDTVSARRLLAEAELALTRSRLTSLTSDRFWESVDEDLQRLGPEVARLKSSCAPAAFLAVLSAARARIERYR